MLKAKEQIGRLTPLVEDGRRYTELSAAIEELRLCREALSAYFARHKEVLLETQIAALETEIQKISYNFV